MTKQVLKQQLKQAMLAQDKERTSVLRLLLSSIGYYEIEKGGAGYEANEEDVLTVLQKEVKQRRDSIEQFKAGRRPDLVDKETNELKLLQTFLPEQLSEEDIKKLVQDAIAKTGAVTLKDMGKVMGVAAPQMKGKADGTVVSRIVREKLKPA